jgi:cytochrome c oxidase subunit 4
MDTPAEHAIAGTAQTFLKVWTALLAITGVEVFIAYLHLAAIVMLTALLGLSVIKAVLIIAYFMHLKFERISLFFTLFPMLILCCMLLLFVLMPDSMRLLEMRPR